MTKMTRNKCFFLAYLYINPIEEYKIQFTLDWVIDSSVLKNTQIHYIQLLHENFSCRISFPQVAYKVESYSIIS